MSISVGDKYVIEIGAVAELPEGKKKYFIKPFESLVFDRKGLEQLEKFDGLASKEYDLGYKKGLEDGILQERYETKLIPELKKQEYDRGFKDGYIKYLKAGADEKYNKGYNEALEDTSDLIAYIDNTFIQEYFPVEYNNGLNFYDLNAKYGLAYILERWKKYLKKEKITIGDEVSNEDVTRTIIVTNIYANDYFDGIDFNGAVYSDRDPKLWNKTGRHFEIIELLNQLRGNKDENNNWNTGQRVWPGHSR